MRTRLAASSALIALLFILVPLAYAATYTYTGVSGSNDWATSAKWTSSTIPGVGDDAVVNLDFAGADIDSNTGAPASVNTLTFNGYTGGLSSSAAFKIPITVANGATFNFKSLNENTISGNAVFNGDSSNNGGTITGNATFNDTSSAYGTINGNAIFNDTSYFAGTVLGDVTLNTDCYGGVAPTGGAITIDGSGTCGAWLYPSVVGGTLFGSDAIELTTFTFINGASSDGDITGDVTFNDTAFHSQQTITGDVIFNDDSETYGPIVGNVTFNDNSFFDWSASITGNATFFGDVTDLNGTISGTKTRHYTASATTVRDFLAEGMDEIIADGAATVVDISGATYDCTITFTEVNGGQFSPDPGCGGGTYTFDNHDVSNDWASIGGWLEGVVAGASDHAIITLATPSSMHLKLNSGAPAIVDTLTLINHGVLGIDLTATNGATFNNSSSLSDSATLTGNATFNDSSQTGAYEHIIGNVTFNDDALSGGYILGTVVFNGNSSHSSYEDSRITGNVTFNGASANGGNITGDVIFNGTSLNGDNGVITGDATFNTTGYGGGAPSGGVFTITNNDQFSNLHWGGSVSGTIYGSDAMPITEWIFNGYAYNEGTIPGNATFNGDNTELYSPGTVAGTKTRHYTADTTVTRDFIADGPWTVIADGSDVIVDVTDATYDGTTTFVEQNGGLFVPCAVSPAGCGGSTASSGGGNNGGSRSNNRPVTPATPTPVPSLPNPPASCYAFTRTLEKGDNDKGVRKLQQFLNTHGYVVSASGPGSRGRETSIFGNATEIALARFQEKHGDTLLAPYGLTKGTGALGTKTKEKINTEFKVACDSSNPPPSVSDPIPWYVDDTPEHPLDPNPGDGAAPPTEEREASAIPVLGTVEIEETPPPRGEGPTPTTNENPDRPTTDPAPRAPSLLPPPIASLVALMTDLFRDPSSVAAVGLVPLVSATGLLISVGSLIPIALPTVGAPADILLSLKRFWDILLTALHIRKRRPWGVVYDSVTKRPISPATVRLTDAYGTVLATTQTDLDGRFGFLTGPGAYRIEVVKRDYAFPSTRVLGRDWDEVYTSLYTGGPLTIAADATLRFNIPIDPIGLEWKDFAEQSYRRFHYYSEADRAFRFISAWAFRAGFLSALVIAWTTQTPYEIGILIAYAAVGALRLLGIGPRPYGTLLDKHTREPLAFARLSLSTNSTSEPIHAVSDQLGRYYLLASDGSYELEVASRSSADTYTPIHRATVTIRNGVLNTRLLV